MKNYPGYIEIRIKLLSVFELLRINRYHNFHFNSLHNGYFCTFFLPSTDFFSKLTFFKTSHEKIRISNSLDQDHIQGFV